MLTYQIRPRVLMVETGELTFPNHAEIKVRFEGSPAFGGDSPPGRTVRLGSVATSRWDANRGRSDVIGMPPLDPLDVVIPGNDVTVRLNATTLQVGFECPERGALLGALGTLRYLIPLLLNVEFSDPPVVATTYGRVGDVEFNWQVEWTAAMFEAVEQPGQELKVLHAWQRLPLVADGGDARLRVALYYFYKACRLEQAGYGPSEFLAEILLNLAKTLEVLFPARDGKKTRDVVRNNLRRLGYSDDEVEGNFLPAMALRDEMDVAHVSLATFTPAQLGTIFRYAEAAEQHFRKLLQRVIEAIESHSLTLQPYEDRGPRPQAMMLVERLGRRYGGAMP